MVFELISDLISDFEVADKWQNLLLTQKLQHTFILGGARILQLGFPIIKTVNIIRKRGLGGYFWMALLIL